MIRLGTRAVTRLFSFLLLAALAAPAVGQDPDALAREADKQLRTSERSMFAGKPEAALEQLEAAAALVEQVRAKKADHPKLKTLDAKVKKLRRDLARRLPKKAPPTEKTPPPDAGPQDVKLPAGVAKRLRDVDAKLASFERDMARESTAKPEERAKSAGRFLAAARELLAEIDKQYGAQVPKDHPTLTAALQKIGAAESRIADLLEAAAAKAPPPPPPPPSSDEIAKDRETVLKLYQQFRDELSMIHGNSLVYGPEPKHAQEALTQLHSIEKSLPALQPALAALATRYGQKSMEIDHQLHQWKVPPNERFATKLEELIRGVGNIQSSRQKSAEDVARRGADMLAYLDRMSPDIRLRQANKAKELLRLGQQLDANNTEINERLGSIDDRIAAMSEAIEAEIDAKTWAGHVEEFAGPGDVESLSKAALAYFRGDDRWGANPKKKVEVLAVAVRGPWQVAERDIFGRTVRWRLPIHVAVTDEAMREKDIARVYELSIVAMEGPAGEAAKAPPFDGYWVGNSWMMRLAKL